MDKGAAIGLDIGGGSTKLGLVAADGELLKAARVVLPEGADFAAIVALARDFGLRDQRVKARHIRRRHRAQDQPSGADRRVLHQPSFRI